MIDNEKVLSLGFSSDLIHSNYYFVAVLLLNLLLIELGRCACRTFKYAMFRRYLKESRFVLISGQIMSGMFSLVIPCKFFIYGGVGDLG